MSIRLFISSDLMPLPIIGMSANTDKDSQSAAKAAGMSTFIAKVINPIQSYPPTSTTIASTTISLILTDKP